MFNLEQAIAGWRQKMLAAGIETPVPLEELELHLREEMESQVRAGVEEKQAFEMAVKCVGDNHALKAEFKKVFRMPFGVFGIILVGCFGCGNILHGLLQLQGTDFGFAFIGGGFSGENLLIGPGTNLIMGCGSLYVGGWMIWKAILAAKMRNGK